MKEALIMLGIAASVIPIALRLLLFLSDKLDEANEKQSRKRKTASA